MMAIFPPTSPTTFIGGFSLGIKPEKRIHQKRLSFTEIIENDSISPIIHTQIQSVIIPGTSSDTTSPLLATSNEKLDEE